MKYLYTLYKRLELNKLDRKTKLNWIENITNNIKVNPNLIQNVSIDKILFISRDLLTDTETSIRTATLRMIRYMLWNNNSLKVFLQLNIQMYVVVSIERESKQIQERIQALKIIRSFLYLNHTIIPVCFVRSIVAISSQKDDSLRRLSLETLRELALMNTKIVTLCDGYRTLVDAILDPTFQDLTESLVLSMMYIYDNPETRKYARPATELELLFVPFTETDTPPGNERKNRWNAAKKAIIIIMQTWTGIFLLTSHPYALPSIIDLLMQPVSVELKKAIVSLIADIFSISLNYHDNDRPLTNTLTNTGGSYMDTLELHRVHLLLSMISCGLANALVHLSTSSDDVDDDNTIGENPTSFIPNNYKTELNELSSSLLQFFLSLCSKYLPATKYRKLASLPNLLNVSYPSESDICDANVAKIRRKSILAQEVIDELYFAGISKKKIEKFPNLPNGIQIAGEIILDNAEQNNDNNYNEYIDEIRIRYESTMDEPSFKDMVYTKSRVLLTKDWFKWDWNIILYLLEGPLNRLCNSSVNSRVSEILQKTKFFHRLSGFYRCDPGNKGFFAQLPWLVDYLPYIRPALLMYSTLLNNNDGLVFLKTDRRGQLLSEIAKALELETRPEAVIVESHVGALQARMFSPEFVNRRMLREYFTLLGLMSGSLEGLQLLEQSNLLGRLLALGKKKGHDFLCRLILVNLDFHNSAIRKNEGNSDSDTFSRTLLRSWLDTGSGSLCLYILSILGDLLASSSIADKEQENLYEWAVDVIISQLPRQNDTALAALDVLETVILNHEGGRRNGNHHLLKIILMNPTYLFSSPLYPKSKSLLLKFLAVPEGLLFLQKNNKAGNKNGSFFSLLLTEWKSKKLWTYHYKNDKMMREKFFRSRPQLEDVERGDTFLSTIVDAEPRNSIPEKTKETKFFPASTAMPIMMPTIKNANAITDSKNWIYRLPWNIEVKLVGPPGSGPSSTLTLDTYIQSKMNSFDVLTIKGVVVDARNRKQPALVNSQQNIETCLFVGVQPINKKGYMLPHPRSDKGFIISYSDNPSVGSVGNSSNNDRLQSNSIDGSVRSSPSDDIGPNNSNQNNEIFNNHTDLDEVKDWSVCKPSDRKSLQDMDVKKEVFDSNTSYYIDEEDNFIFPIRVPNEPTSWHFSITSEDDSNSKYNKIRLLYVEFNLRLISDEPKYQIYSANALDGTNNRVNYHFFGELAKTKKGCDVLIETGVIEEYIDIIINDRSSNLLVNEKQAAILAVGYIGSSNRGLETLLLLNESKNNSTSLIDHIFQSVREETHISLRGTYFKLLNLFARCSLGKKILLENDWITNNTKDSHLIALPSNYNNLFDNRNIYNTNSYCSKSTDATYYLSPANFCLSSLNFESNVLFLKNKEWDEILSLIGDLSNHITQKESFSSLNKLRKNNNYNDHFTHPVLYLQTFALLEKYNFKLNVRQFVNNFLFDKICIGNKEWEFIQMNGIEKSTNNISSMKTASDFLENEEPDEVLV